MSFKNVVIDPVTKKFVSLKSERGQEILAMQAAALEVIPAEEEEDAVFTPVEEEEDAITAEDVLQKAEREQRELADKYTGILDFEMVPFIKERIDSGKFVKKNTDRQNKNGTLAIEINMGETSKKEMFVFYKTTGHIVRNGKTFIHRGYKDCGNLAETADAFEKYWTRREEKYLRNLEK